jgi:branched-chain amino acid transport system ATP-binding protein
MLLDVERLACGYGGKRVVHDVSLTVARGEVVAVLGHNGAGKTTLLRGIVGTARIMGGRLWYDGRDISRRPVMERVHGGIAFVPSGGRVFGELTVRENLMLAGSRQAQGQVRQDLARTYELFPQLAMKQNASARSLSGGERQMLALAMALMMRPQLLLLDEPSGGLAPIVVAELYQAIRRLLGEYGVAALLVEQDAAMALEVATTVLVLKSGRTAYLGAPDGLATGPALARMLAGAG